MESDNLYSLIKSPIEGNVSTGLSIYGAMLKELQSYFEEKNEEQSSAVTFFKIGDEDDFDTYSCNKIECIRNTKNALKSQNRGQKITFEVQRDGLIDSTVRRCYNCNVPVVSELCDYDGELDHFNTTEFDIFEDYEIYELDILCSCLKNSKLKPEKISISECIFVCKFYDIIKKEQNI